MDIRHLSAVNHCLRHLSKAVSTARLYSLEHTQVKKLCRIARSSLLEAMGGNDTLSLMRVDQQLAVDGHPLDNSLYSDRFARLLKLNGIGHIKFLQNISEKELLALVTSLSSSEKVAHSSENLRLGQVEVRHRSALNSVPKDQKRPPTSHDRSPQDIASNIPLETTQLLEDVSSEELARIMEVYEAVKNSRKLQVAGLSEIVVSFIDLFAGYADPLLTLVPMRNMDEYTFTHSLNVCLLNLAQATALGIEGQLLHDIGLSAMLHDVGKLFIPKDVLNKPGKLDEKEWELIQKHPVYGAEYLLDNPGVPRMAVLNAYEHHLRFDLRGYPKVKDEWQQNLCSQITSISDIFDSLRTRRPYREPIEVGTVLSHIEELIGSQLHPLLVENFLRLMKKIPPAKAS